MILTKIIHQPYVELVCYFVGFIENLRDFKESTSYYIYGNLGVILSKAIEVTTFHFDLTVE